MKPHDTPAISSSGTNGREPIMNECCHASQRVIGLTGDAFAYILPSALCDVADPSRATYHVSRRKFDMIMQCKRDEKYDDLKRLEAGKILCS